MKLTTFVATLAGGCLATTAMAQSDALAQIAELRAELAVVKAQAGSSTLTEERAAEIKAIVRDTLADADTRASLQGGGNAVAGYDNGLFIGSADGNFKLKVGVLEQVRFVWQFDSEETMGFENRRTQLAFGGNMFDPTWTYGVVVNATPYSTPYGEDSGFDIADAWVNKSLEGGWGVTAGQFRTPFTRATLVGDGKQLMADYSPTDYNFSAGYQQGVMGSWTQDMFKAMVSIGNGIGQTNGTWADTDTNADAFNLSVRAELKLAGSWAQFNKETSWRGEEFGMLVGAAWLDSDNNGAGGNVGPFSFNNADGNYGSDSSAFTVDGTAFFGGANLAMAYTYAGQTGDDSYGVSVQGGLFVSDEVEVWGAWNYLDGADAPIGSYLQVGANWYFHKNGAKWTTQVNIPMNDSDTANTYLSDGAWGLSDNDDTSILTQLQFMF